METFTWDYPCSNAKWLGCNDPVAARHWVLLRSLKDGGLERAAGIEYPTLLQIQHRGQITQGDDYEL